MKKPECKLINENGNIFNLLAITRKTLLANGFYNESIEVVRRVTSSHSYDEALKILGYVDDIQTIIDPMSPQISKNTVKKIINNCSSHTSCRLWKNNNR